MPAPAAWACHPVAGDPVVEVSRVTVELAKSTILRDVNLQVRAGEIVAVMGPNGGGKTTLLHALLGLVTLARGSIRVCDKDVAPVSASRLAGKVGMVFQNADHQLIAPTVSQEALFAARTLRLATATIQREADPQLQRAGLADRKEDHPYRLSWGQKRRLNLISAVLHDPTLLLLDEPFAGQDWANVAFMLDIIEKARERGSACVMVTHDPRAVLRGCTRVLFISQGQVIVDAPVAQAFEQLTEMGHQAYVPGRTTAGDEV